MATALPAMGTDDGQHVGEGNGQPSLSVAERLRKLKERGVRRGYTMDVDQSATSSLAMTASRLPCLTCLCNGSRNADERRV